MVAIAKAIGSEAKLIILDEPTTALLPSEVAILFGHMRRLAARGPFLSLCQPSPGRSVRDRRPRHRAARRPQRRRLDRDEMSRRAIISAIVGGQTSIQRRGWSAPTSLWATPCSSAAERSGGGRVADLIFEVRAREILGFAGLPGSGAEEALDLLYGRLSDERRHAVVSTATRSTFRSPRDAKAAGIALVPKDRHAESLLPGASVRENISLPNLETIRHGSGRALHPPRQGARCGRGGRAATLGQEWPASRRRSVR